MLWVTLNVVKKKAVEIKDLIRLTVKDNVYYHIKTNLVKHVANV